ncbi:small nuclear RNA activating complex, polypeptide 3 [Irineochytrium annulatum]|nr:small nuclear RNA activating complex, polypeptide 3 [Irineochytrium annulatum]
MVGFDNNPAISAFGRSASGGIAMPKSLARGWTSGDLESPVVSLRQFKVGALLILETLAFDRMVADDDGAVLETDGGTMPSFIRIHDEFRPVLDREVAEDASEGTSLPTSNHERDVTKSDFLEFNEDHGNQSNLNTPARKLSSSYFFIEGMFYVDMRHPNAVDYSENVINWSRHDDRYKLFSQRPFQKALMSGQRFIDMAVRFNIPYLFVHQGNCEHIFVIKEARLPDPARDNFDKSQYPRTVFESKPPSIKCNVCGLYAAT